MDITLDISKIASPQSAVFQPAEIVIMNVGMPEETAFANGQVAYNNEFTRVIGYQLTIDEYAAWGVDNSYIWNLVITKNGYSLA